MADAEASADARLLRGVRWRLIAWSGGTTLVVLLLLGATLYAVVANSLAAAARQPLEERATTLVQFVERVHPGRERPPTGPIFGEPGSGTFAFLVSQSGVVIGPGDLAVEGLPNEEGVRNARARGRDLREVRVGRVPVRVLSTTASGPFGEFVVQVVQDRVAEQRTLDVLLAVLVAGGGVALIVATTVGAGYAQRALVPIRGSLAAQRVALQRQREFAADASHELRTPLAIIRGSVEHLRRNRSRPVAEVGTALDDIEAEVAQLTSLVEDLLLLARSDSGALDLVRNPVELGDLAADAATALETLATARNVGLRVDPEPAPVVGDGTRLRQLITILVDNAIRHSPPGGTVGVGVRVEAGAAVLVVEDEGPGIRPEDLPHVFDRFWRAPGAPKGGTGLGLAIAASIATRHGGRISAANRPGGGGRFSVILPLRASGAGGAPDSQDPLSVAGHAPS